jgi:hypothetical protein
MPRDGSAPAGWLGRGVAAHERRSARSVNYHDHTTRPLWLKPLLVTMSLWRLAGATLRRLMAAASRRGGLQHV